MRRVRIFIVMCVLVLSWSAQYYPPAQADTDLIVTNGAGGQGTNGWTNPANAQGTADNNTYATAAPGNNSRIAGIWNSYNFDSNLPLHAAITKVEIIAQYNVNSTLSVANLEVQAVVGGTNCPSSPFIHSAEPAADTDFTADVTSCRSWTRSDLLNANFGTRITAHRGNSLLFGVTFSLDYAQVRVTYNTPDYDQVAYRWYDNADSTATGTALANQNTAPTLYAPQDRVRLRILLHVTTTALLISSEQFKLQFAQKSGSCSGLSYADVTGSSLIAYYNNPTPNTNIALTTSGSDPTHNSDTIIAQTYNESSPLSTNANVSTGQDGMWDIALIGNGASANTTYCFRMVKNNGTALTTYTIYPELVTSPTGNLNVDVVDSGGSSVTSPSSSFSSLVTSFNCSATTATLGVSAERIRLRNTTATATWTLSIAATSGSTALWSAGTPKYDFNDGSGSPPGCAAGIDSDAYAGQMSIDPSSGTIVPRSVNACSNTGVTKGSSAAFAEGSLNSITLMNASGSAPAGCYWDLTGVNLTQQIPGDQPAGSYSINLTLTAVAS